MYLHKEVEHTPQQNLGISFHKSVEKKILETNKVDIGNTKLIFNKPECEKKVYVPYNELITLSAVFDCLDGDTLYEWKTGATSAFEYANKLQIPFYFFVLKQLSLPVKRAFLVHWDFDTKKSSFVHVVNSKKKIADGENLVQTLGPEIYEHFNNLGIL